MFPQRGGRRPPIERVCLGEPGGGRTGSRTAADDGVGLGLSIVAAIAKAHNATLTLTPVQHGGLDIEISFPTTTATPATWHRALAAT